ncbi:aldehyde dehydrogenase [Gluconacetobacter liquefaciens]|uniref:Aldehyde dehydrogenase n=1 Tax=Gluconacetobacter liquefaciens TaxID=89584 RepID=A0A370G5C2_GLULI|nr:aldehyde dehydrogenase [Gluconacetobacter liquefaciens]MBB2186588.1 aldehyde dehydrogenase [Gluconacetobacter liquefaciens]RDI38256.1 lactaldehyde dehydrogenase [Gluconacetobacter liquefaciens]GBR07431.1 NAD-dependent aldehyde dehydrogenase [Gluconacetobacter liquefaciens NRIC 0522]GEB36687.1 aldehyde dehydrogenase [Gluconacetobacter liquefaciens]
MPNNQRTSNDVTSLSPRHYQNYIGGTFRDHATDTLEVHNPANGDLLGYVPNSDAATVDEAVSAAIAAQPSWEKLPAIQRAGYLRQISAGIRRRRDHLAAIIVEEQGKIRNLAETEVAFAADYFDYMAEWARRLEGEVLTSDRVAETILLMHKPLGTVAGILPWNFPFFMIARKVGPALLTGNTIVIKPSEETPINAHEFAALVAETDLPPGVFNLVSGTGVVCGHSLTAHTGVNMVTFTGSVGTGVKIMETAARNLTRVNLELGGKAPAIVLADADLDLAARAIHASRIINTGQVCNCAERVYVDQTVYEPFLARLKDLFANTRYGDPSRESGLDMGPLINHAAVTRISGIVENARQAGAEIIVGGQVCDTKPGFHYQPTLLANVTPDMEVMRRETFGPVLPVMAVSGLDEAIALSNDSEYGLTSSIYSSNINAVLKACRELKFGETYVNRENFEAMQGFHAGRRKSGIGGADGKHGLYEFMETHVVYIQGTP